MKTFTLPTPIYVTNSGEANGYVAIPVGHKLHGINYNEIHREHEINVHGGITFSGLASNFSGLPEEIDPTDWVFGFDTCHFYSGPHWTKEKVQEEAQSLARQLKAL